VPALQVGVADQAVASECSAVQQLVGVEQALANIDDVQAQDGVAYGDVVDFAHRSKRRHRGGDAAHRGSGVAHRAGPGEGKHDVGAGAHTPHTQRGAQVVRDLVSAVLGGDVDTAAQAHGGVKQDTAQCIDEIVSAALKHAVQSGPHVGDVAEYIADAGASRFGREVTVGIGHGLQQCTVHGVVEREHAAVIALP